MILSSSKSTCRVQKNVYWRQFLELFVVKKKLFLYFIYWEKISSSASVNRAMAQEDEREMRHKFLSNLQLSVQVTRIKDAMAQIYRRLEVILQKSTSYKISTQRVC